MRITHIGFILGIVGAIAAPVALAQDWRGGTGRLEGKVLDSDGNPIASAVVKLDLPGRGGIELKADKKGKWAILGLTSGQWNVDIQAEGFVPKQLSATVMQEVRVPPIVVKLERAKPAGPPPEVVEANRKAEEAYRAGRFDEARQEYEKLLALRPDLANQIHQQIGFSYIQEKKYEKALEHLQKVLDAEPGNMQVRALAAQAALEGGMIEKGRALLAELQDASVTNPDVFFNIGVNFLNAGLTEEAIGFFTKAVTLDPRYVDGYYRRALSFSRSARPPSGGPTSRRSCSSLPTAFRRRWRARRSSRSSRWLVPVAAMAELAARLYNPPGAAPRAHDLWRRALLRAPPRERSGRRAPFGFGRSASAPTWCRESCPWT